MWLNKLFYIALIQSILLLCSNEVSCFFGIKVGGSIFGGGKIQNPVKGIGTGIGNIMKPGVEIGKGIKGTIGHGIEGVKNVFDPSGYLGKLDEEVKKMIPDPEKLSQQVAELVKTTAVFATVNGTLNCLGLPIRLFDKILEEIFKQQTSAEDVKFYFSSRRSPFYKSYRVMDQFTFDQIDFDIRRPTVLMVHGFMSSGKESWLSNMKNALLSLDDVNTIVVDWQQGSNTWNYYSAAISTRIVGLQIAKLFAKLRGMALESGQVPNMRDWGFLYFVGHSLGSHISAHAAYLIRESQKGQEQSWHVGRITGLDPAQPCFTTADPTLKLGMDDAPFVDIVHTNGRNRLFLGLGLPDPLGFVDFYPNGGKAQPGCSDIDVSIFNFPLVLLDIVKESVCSHGRSHAYYIESIVDLTYENCTFLGFQWDGKSENYNNNVQYGCNAPACTKMGIEALADFDKNPGRYYVPTNREAPFCASDASSKIPNFNADPNKEEPNKNIITELSKTFLPARY